MIQKHATLLFSFTFLVFIVSLVLGISSTAMDETILAEQAYWFSELGFVKSKLFTGMGQGWETRQYHYHKLFIWTGAFFIQLFGWSLYVIKAVPLTFTAVLFFTFYRWIKNNFNQQWALVGVSILLMQNELLSFTFYFRPEVMLMASGLLSFICFHYYLKKSKTTYLLAAAVLSGLSVLIHLNGIVFCVALGCVLLFNKKFKGFVFFGSASALIALLYLADLGSLEAFENLKLQFAADPNLEKKDFSLLAPIVKLLNFHLFFFWSPKEAVLFIPFLLTIVVYFKTLMKEHRNLMLFTTALILSLSALAHGHSTKYAMIFYPFVVYIIIIGINKAQQTKPMVSKLYLATLILFFVTQGVYAVRQMKEYDNAVAINNQISQHIDYHHNSILATDSYVFNELPKADVISFLGYRYGRFNYQGLEPDQIQKEDVVAFANEYNRDYIIIIPRFEDKRVLSILKSDQLRTGDRILNFEVTAQEEAYIVLKKMNTQ